MVNKKEDSFNFSSTNLTSTDVNHFLRNSVTSKESKILELLKDVNNKTPAMHKEYNQNDQNDLSSQSDNAQGSIQDVLCSTNEKHDDDSL